MKKKGLIVATIVMVLVLAVSLTTATYAWFTTTAQTTIESITIQAAAGADIKIGMATSNAYKAGATADDFQSGSLTFTEGAGDTGTWAGEPGMGFELVTGLTLDKIAKATGYGTASSIEWTKDVTPSNTTGHYYKDGDSYYPCPKVGEAPTETYSIASGSAGSAEKFVPGTSTGGSIVKASGAGSTVDTTSVEAAIINTDYLHFTIGLAPSKENIDTITLSMFVNPGTNKSTLGVEGALYFYYRINNEVKGGDGADKDDAVWKGGEVYAGYTYQTAKSNIIDAGATSIGGALNDYYDVTSYTDETVLNVGWKQIAVELGEKGTPMVVDTIYQIEFYVFYDGTDPDCVNAALGSQCEVIFAVTNTFNA